MTLDTHVDNPQPPEVHRKGFSITAFILGIVAVAFAMIPILCFIAPVLALAALGFGVAALATKGAARKRTITALVLGLVALIIASVVSTATIASFGDGLAEASAGLSSSSEPEVSQNAAVAEPSTSPEPATPPATPSAPAPAPVPADVVYQGSGDSVLTIALPDGATQVGVATIAHDGSSNFAVWSLDANMTQQDLLVNTIGGYQGTVLLDARAGQHTTALGITADGNWSVTLHSIHAVREFTDAVASGTGDDVLVYRGPAGAAAINHDGQSNFAIWSYGSRTDLVVNTIGAYAGTVRWGAGPSLISVKADGNWNITIG